MEEEKSYYEKKEDKIFEIFTRKVQENVDEYEPFLNVPFTKSMIRVRYEYDALEQKISEEDLIEMTIDEAIESLIYSSLVKSTPIIEKDIFLSNNLVKSSYNEIKGMIDYIVGLNIKITQDQPKQLIDALSSFKYLFYGEKHYRILNNFKYKDINLVYVENLEDIYLSNSSVIDLNSIDVKYTEYMKEDFDGLDDGLDSLEFIPEVMKKSVMTLNCVLGDVNIVKFKCLFGENRQFYRKLKLQKILKNEIDI